VIAVDATEHSAAGELADEFYVVPRCSDPSFIPQILDICAQEQVSLLVPTIDTELRPYAEARDMFRRIGTVIAVSDPVTIGLCEDKALTHEWLMRNGFPAPRQSTPDRVLKDSQCWDFPLIVKPRRGSASSGLRIVRNLKDLEASSLDSSLIVQELISGQEFTVNCFVDQTGHCLCAIPHLRMEIRSGEVSKGITVRHQPLISLVRRLVESLPGPFGALNVQCFLTPDDQIRIIEINARFGGGYPLAHRAGATFTTWLLEDIHNLSLAGPFDQWQEGLLMLRYDHPVFVEPGKSRHRIRENVTPLYSF
jgi:carbamoyl-phosphate synthase large subunit